MRTGKHQFNYQAYAIKWAINIMANKRGYSVNRAYQIDRVFGTLVEQWLDYYKTQLEYAKRFSAISGSLSNMLGAFDNFGENLSENIKNQINNPLSYKDTKNERVVDTEVLDYMTAFDTTTSKILYDAKYISSYKFSYYPKGLQTEVDRLNRRYIGVLSVYRRASERLDSYIVKLCTGKSSAESENIINKADMFNDYFKAGAELMMRQYQEEYDYLQYQYKGYLMND